MLCRDLYRNGCSRTVSGPDWIHPEEWVDGDGRPTGPELRDGLAEEMVRTLATSGSSAVRIAVAEHPGTPAGVLDALTRDDADAVRFRALGCTRDIARLAEAATAPDLPSRRGVARNPATPEPILIDLSRDPGRDVRLAVTLNPSTPRPTVDAATADRDPIIRTWAYRRTRSPARMPDGATSETATDRGGAAANQHLPDDLARLLAADPDRQVRLMLLRNPTLRPDLRATLEAAEDMSVGLGARHPPLWEDD